ncbi:hypothetical protein ACIA8G_15620 [Lentzea sp. NPDC051213]|uniref:hypothetical protein n=1 Tax=Lentzea sp. NPDC051213 TaxID=3364126 RepID=UPI0037877E6A
MCSRLVPEIVVTAWLIRDFAKASGVSHNAPKVVNRMNNNVNNNNLNNNVNNVNNNG